MSNVTPPPGPGSIAPATVTLTRTDLGGRSVSDLLAARAQVPVTEAVSITAHAVVTGPEAIDFLLNVGNVEPGSGLSAAQGPAPVKLVPYKGPLAPALEKAAAASAYFGGDVERFRGVLANYGQDSLTTAADCRALKLVLAQALGINPSDGQFALKADDGGFSAIRFEPTAAIENAFHLQMVADRDNVLLVNPETLAAVAVGDKFPAGAPNDLEAFKAAFPSLNKVPAAQVTLIGFPADGASTTDLGSVPRESVRAFLDEMRLFGTKADRATLVANCIDAAASYRAFADHHDPRVHISAADRALLREGAQQITDFAVVAETSPLVQLVHLEDEIKAHATIMALLGNGRF